LKISDFSPGIGLFGREIAKQKMSANGCFFYKIKHMVIRRRSGSPGLNAPLRIWLLTGASSLVLATMVVMLTTRSVQAGPHYPDLLASVPPASTAVQPAAPLKPVSKSTIAAQRAALLRGIATWYGTVFHGRRTANGETYDMNAMTACHPTLPFGSLVKVVNLRNKRSVVVRINDRGDLAEGRIIDLSKAAADQLAMTERGLAPVVLEVISRGRP
jgi:rare lipoprotein A